MFFSAEKAKETKKIKKFYRQFEPHLQKILKPNYRYLATLKTEKGDVQLELFVEDAPNHVANFVQLARRGEYNGTRFYRVVDSFVVQTGPQKGEGHLKKIKAEINHHDHTQGMVSMAHGPDIDGAKGSFFICLGSIPSLNGEFTIFGKMLSGLEVLKSLKKGSILPDEKEYYDPNFQGDLLNSVLIQEVPISA